LHHCFNSVFSIFTVKLENSSTHRKKQFNEQKVTKQKITG